MTAFRISNAARFLLSIVLALALVAPLASAEDEKAPAYEGGKLLDKALDLLRRNFTDGDERFDAIAETYGPKARAAASQAEEREVVHEALGRLPMSHLSLLSDYAASFYQDQLRGRAHTGFGFELLALESGYFVLKVVKGSPAAEAGLRRGDRVLRVDGQPVATSPLLDLRTDDCHLPDAPIHLLRPHGKTPVHLEIQRSADAKAETLIIGVGQIGYHAGDRARSGMREVDGRKVGYVPLTFMYLPAARFVKEMLDGPLAEADAFVLDARGRGGSPIALFSLVKVLRQPERLKGRPIVLLVDGRTRSAKEILAEQFKKHGIGPILGERTAGAVRPGRFLPLDKSTWIVCPMGTIKTNFSELELVGHPADIEVADRLTYANGEDPILAAGLREAAKRAAPKTAREPAGAGK